MLKLSPTDKYKKLEALTGSIAKIMAVFVAVSTVAYMFELKTHKQLANTAVINHSFKNA